MRAFNWFIILLTLILVGSSCNDIGNDAYHTSIADPFSRWKAYNLKDYSLKQALSCFCVYGGIPMKVVVRNNHIVNVVELSTGNALPQSHWEFYKTVNELFELVREVSPGSVARFVVDYDHTYGLPSMLYVDPDEDVADEEYGYESELLSRD